MKACRGMSRLPERGDRKECLTHIFTHSFIHSNNVFLYLLISFNIKYLKCFERQFVLDRKKQLWYYNMMAGPSVWSMGDYNNYYGYVVLIRRLFSFKMLR